MSKVFVYGTLRPSLRAKYGFYGNSIPHGNKISDGTIKGTIHKVGGRVPEVVLGGPHNVVGELVEYTSEEMGDIDRLEGGYNKERTRVLLPDGSTVQAYVYTARDKPINPPIPSGDWADYLLDYPNL